MTRKTKVLLLAGGLGTRLRPLTNETPKCLVKIAGRPLLDYWFDLFAAAGLCEILINTHHLPDIVRDFIQDKNIGGRFQVHESFEPQLLGSAGTLHANPYWVAENEDCLIVYADNLSNVNLAALIAYHISHSDPFTMLLFKSSQPSQCGIATLGESDRVVDFAEKPQQPTSNLANAGVYVVTGTTYHQIAAMNAFDLGFDVLPKFIGRMRGFLWEGYHRDIGSSESLSQAEADVVNGKLAGFSQSLAIAPEDDR